MSRPGNRYVVEASLSLEPGDWQAMGAELVAPEGIAVTETTVSLAPNQALGFYRVRLVESSVPLR
jgi:hypothetical protein